MSGEATTTTERRSLRTFLEQVEESSDDQLVRVPRPVSSNLELSAVVKALEPRGNPIALFEQVIESEIPVVVGLCASRSRIALALGEPQDRCHARLRDAVAQPIPVERVDGGPVKERVVVGADVDLGELPISVHSPKDSGRYITSACTLSRDPQTGNTNVGIYRMRVIDERRICLLTAPSHDLAKIVAAAEQTGRPTEVAIVIGHHPALSIASQAMNPMSIDSLELAGALLGEPLSVTAAETLDLDVPSEAEIVIEARILPNVRDADGPFGEFTYYYGHGQPYVCEVTAITRRSDAIFADLHPSHVEHRCLALFPGFEESVLSRLQAAVPSVKDVHIPDVGAALAVFVSMDKAHDADSMQVLQIVLGMEVLFKHAVVVDGDVDVRNPAEVFWAVNTRFQADRDMLVVPRTRGNALDPSSTDPGGVAPTAGGVTTKVGLDATKPVAGGFSERSDVLPPGYENLDLEEYLADAVPSLAR